ncbi:MAG TPA: GDCCVxC domain-containing (seleno)protein [Gammaproteobacteria bacterium]|nr:GDCCVxC domain-containing (seleno)protein [Gammaproteobacteria bacterium]
MPADACQFYYQCTAWKTLLRPQRGDCCVFCSYGTVPYPPKRGHLYILDECGNAPRRFYLA